MKAGEDPIGRDAEDDARIYPAARCRECGCVTFVCSIDAGMILDSTDTHRRGCSKPLGRLDLILLIGDEELERELFGKRLRQALGDAEIERIAADLAEILRREIS